MCVARSTLLMNVPIPLVSEAAAALGLRLREAPVRLPSIRFALAWHARFQHDSARLVFAHGSKALSALSHD